MTGILLGIVGTLGVVLACFGLGFVLAALIIFHARKGKAPWHAIGVGMGGALFGFVLVEVAALLGHV